MTGAGLAGLALVLLAVLPAKAQENWSQVVSEARGQTVYFNAWGGSRAINDYIAWAAHVVEARYGVHLVEVKLDDTATAVSAILSEKRAGKTSGGSVDLVWINGENFASMKHHGLLQAKGWADSLPNRIYMDTQAVKATAADFTVPTEGLESPWGLARLVFFYDGNRSPPASLPTSAAELLDWARAHPGRFTYPLPPDFTGTALLKQVLVEGAPDPSRLMRAPDDDSFRQQTAPLWAWLEAIHPLLWHQGKQFPQNYPALEQMLADRDLDLIFAFNPSEASAAIARGDLPDTVRAFTFARGTLGNSHYLAIPFNARARAGALVVANFLLSPEAQARKQDPRIWGDPTVLSMETLSPSQKAAFDAVAVGPATLSPTELGPQLPEPHPGWIERIKAEWNRRYGSSDAD